MGTLRLFLALSVLMWHFGAARPFALVHAGVAVILFFIISGFYMALVINEKYGRNTGAFYGARFLRIFPTYWAICLIGLAQQAVLNGYGLVAAPVHLALWQHASIGTMNVIIVGQGFFQCIVDSLGFQEPNAISNAVLSTVPATYFNTNFIIIGQAWSLALELGFYALAPFVVQSLWRAGALLIASIGLRWSMVALGFTSEIWGYHFLPASLCLFLLGSVAYHLYAVAKRWRWTPRVGAASFAALFIIFGVSWLRSGVMFGIDRATGYDTPRLWAFYLAFAIALPFVFARFKSNRVDRFIGELSYPLYLVHGIVISQVYHARSLGQWGYGSQVIAVLGSLAAAWLVHVTVASPVDRIRARRAAQAVAVP